MKKEPTDKIFLSYHFWISWTVSLTFAIADFSSVGSRPLSCAAGFAEEGTAWFSARRQFGRLVNSPVYSLHGFVSLCDFWEGGSCSYKQQINGECQDGQIRHFFLLKASILSQDLSGIAVKIFFIALIFLCRPIRRRLIYWKPVIVIQQFFVSLWISNFPKRKSLGLTNSVSFFHLAFDS